MSISSPLFFNYIVVDPTFISWISLSRSYFFSPNGFSVHVGRTVLLYQCKKIKCYDAFIDDHLNKEYIEITVKKHESNFTFSMFYVVSDWDLNKEHKLPKRPPNHLTCQEGASISQVPGKICLPLSQTLFPLISK